MDTRSQHLLIDAVLKREIEAEDIEHIKYVIEKNLTVVSRVEHKFTPHGETIAFILAESHFTLHTYPEHKYLTMDIYVCNLSTNLEKVLQDIKDVVPIESLDTKLLYRGTITQKEQTANLRFVYLLTVMVAMGSILYEFLLAQSLSTTMGNTALRYNLTIGIYIASMGFGALFYRKLIGKKLFEEFVKVEFLLSCVGGFAPVLVLIIDYLFNVLSTKAGLPFYGNAIQIPIFILNHFLIVLIGFISGLELPLLIDMAKLYQIQKNHRVLAFDYLGTLAGAIFFPLIILPNFHIFTIGYLLSFVNILASLIVVFRMKVENAKWKWGLIITLLIWLIVFYFSNEINSFFISKFYFGGRL